MTGDLVARRPTLVLVGLAMLCSPGGICEADSTPFASWIRWSGCQTCVVLREDGSMVVNRAYSCDAADPITAVVSRESAASIFHHRALHELASLSPRNGPVANDGDPRVITVCDRGYELEVWANSAEDARDCDLFNAVWSLREGVVPGAEGENCGWECIGTNDLHDLEGQLW